MDIIEFWIDIWYIIKDDINKTITYNPNSPLSYYEFKSKYDREVLGIGVYGGKRGNKRIIN